MADAETPTGAAVEAEMPEAPWLRCAHPVSIARPLIAELEKQVGVERRRREAEQRAHKLHHRAAAQVLDQPVAGERVGQSLCVTPIQQP